MLRRTEERRNDPRASLTCEWKGNTLRGERRLLAGLLRGFERLGHAIQRHLDAIELILRTLVPIAERVGGFVELLECPANGVLAAVAQNQQAEPTDTQHRQRQEPLLHTRTSPKV